MATMQPEPEYVGKFTTESLPGFVARRSHESPSTYAGDIELNRFMRKNKHTTPSEFAAFAFDVNGITKSLQTQWVRQRIGVTWVFRSTRFVPAGQNQFVYCTYDYIDDEEKVRQLLAIDEWHAMRAVEDFPKKMALGCKKQDGRKIMPVEFNTPCYFKANTQSLRHFFELRFAQDAEWEIRRLAKAIFELAYKKAPSLFEDFLELARQEF